MQRELLIQTPDGRTRTVPLTGGRLSVGRSVSAELCFPEDAGLSRQHFALEAEGDGWMVQDLGSKNGTLVNNIPLKARLRLNPGDRIAAGHLVLVYAPDTKRFDPGVVVFEGERENPSTAVITNLAGALSNPTISVPRGVKGPASNRALQALIRAGQELSRNRPLEELFLVILDLAIQAVDAHRGVLMLLEDGALIAKVHKGERFRISSAVRDRVLQEKCSLLVRDAQRDEAFRGSATILQQMIHTMMAVPLEAHDRIIGLIYVDSPSVLREFTKDDLSLLTVMANVAAIRIENVRLAEIEEAERITRRELTQAAEIQRGILPGSAPRVACADLAGYNAPCHTVGGDYYGFFPYADGRVGLALADVSGKGMPASLMMMGLQARVEVLAEDPRNLSALVTRLNKAISANSPPSRFITFFFCVLDPAVGELAFANAGHNPPILLRATGEVETLETGGPVLGLLPAACYREGRAALSNGDLLALYSDGLTEATNTDGEEYGEERLIELLQRHRQEPAERLVEIITKSLAEFSAGSPQVDDITLVIAKYAGTPRM
ncbi:MAG TPA: SpoIIE family protein phosphatase [Bryobacteraceae bacterium]|nr:SpoIIE family protein phosphatase [Bryobacteraceae bacterium]